MANCASCHQPDLGGQNEALTLAGPNFMATWRHSQHAACSSSTSQETMPPGQANLPTDQYLIDRGVHPSSRTARRRGAPFAPIGRVDRIARDRTGAGSAAAAPAAASLRLAPAGGRGAGAGTAGGVAGCRRSAGGARGRALAAVRTWRVRRSRGRRGGADADAAARRRSATWRHRRRRSEELRAGDRRDAAQSGSRRLADGAPQLSGVELQPAHRDHAQQREGSQAVVGVADERRPAARSSRCRSCTTA